MTGRITRSAGIPVTDGYVTYGVAGGGYRGVTAGLDAVVAEAAELLAGEYGQDIEIRFNSDRESGGAWLVTPDGRNDRVGISAGVVTASRRRRAECHAAQCEEMARTGTCTWGGPATPSQCEGARECAAGYRAWLAANPEGLMRISVKLAVAAVLPQLRSELAQLPGWNPGTYHCGEVPDVRAAVARCLHFTPPAGGAST